MGTHLFRFSEFKIVSRSAQSIYRRTSDIRVWNQWKASNGWYSKQYNKTMQVSACHTSHTCCSGYPSLIHCVSGGWTCRWLLATKPETHCVWKTRSGGVPHSPACWIQVEITTPRYSEPKSKRHRPVQGQAATTSKYADRDSQSQVCNQVCCMSVTEAQLSGTDTERPSLISLPKNRDLFSASLVTDTAQAKPQT